MNGSGYLSTEAWRELHRTGNLDVRWPIQSAYYIAAEFGEYASHRSCLSRDLARFLRDEQLCAGAEPVLDQLPSSILPNYPDLVQPLPAQEWAMRVFHGMRHPNLWDGVKHLDLCHDQFPSMARVLLERFGLQDEMLFPAAADIGYSGFAGPDAIPSPSGAERYVQQAHNLAAERFEEEQPYATMFAALGVGMLAGMRDRGKLTGWAFRIGNEYLNSLIAAEFWMPELLW